MSTATSSPGTWYNFIEDDSLNKSIKSIKPADLADIINKDEFKKADKRTKTDLMLVVEFEVDCDRLDNVVWRKALCIC